ncbi:DOMON-like domain-containing protein [Sphingomonas sp. dw_22]|uniref:DOMON-like domain-containing protein n=1 Tax=Sphingomonas sp. dw_22 TaxID=2721175 RepID=UPI001BD37C1A|nr:DOMON-like domain-containing protein [Sphingomonas sp. dw_22]
MAIRVPLQLHPDSICAVQAIEVEVSRIAPRRIGLRYFALGGADHIETGSRRGKPERTDELWKTTCFEAFVQAEGDVAYYEFNFATSGNWAAYRFDNRREGMTDARVEAPQAEWSRQPPFVLRAAPLMREEEQEKAAFRANDGWLGARLMLDHAMDLPLGRPWRLGLSAVIEERGGRKSWWALKHPAGAPDFHDPACFTLQLPAAC